MEGEKKRGWRDLFPDPGGAGTTLIVGVIALVAGGGSTYAIKSNDPVIKTVTETRVETVHAPETGSEEIEDEVDLSIGLDKLKAEEEVQEEDLFSLETEFGIRNIAGHEYENAFTTSIYPDEGPLGLTINTKGQYSSMSFIVGIDAEAICPKAEARVWVEDESGHILWGPEQVGIKTPAREENLSLPNPIQVNLVNRSSGNEASCDHGRADVSWGGVRFLSEG